MMWLISSMFLYDLVKVSLGPISRKLGTNEPRHNKTKKESVPSEDSDQPGHSPSLISLCCPHEETLGP